ncbi:MAG TPA: putative sulfate exporter family transporter, partial [Rhizomicrobium sp.]|nr:putative sulfate exporter family transporter [Rhizomicrobium sp.]
IAMFTYPLLPALLHLSPRAFGLWTGASIHEIAQVVAASFQDGHDAGQFGTIAKLTRVSMLAPMVLALGFAAARRNRHDPKHDQAPAPLPWFVLGFIALVGINSVFAIPVAFKTHAAIATTFLLSLALAAMGLETDLRKLAARGLRPAALGALSALFIATFSLGLIKLLA